MTVEIFAVGKLKEAYLRDACGEYTKRLSSFCTLKITELAEYRLPANPSLAEIQKALTAEGEAILQKIPARSAITTLCIEGKSLSSPELAGAIQDFALSGDSHLSFVIGGSHGLSDPVKQAARLRLSMSAMTFPHQLARVLLLEQIYRAFSINAGSQYHK
ncbi:23S rRNA (pseudouridine(1915)-N(3))-methyltransferase RlmH [Oscillospiraceae bacterium MB08-C2-2]|nr:23S rRNA (pseudouridine(1915)-N(3))-methyltransferase RlmH [Oscillospiraceae bacterium MB08-C2-2]